MIRSRFTYASPKVGFGNLANGYKATKANSARLASAMTTDSSGLNATTSALVSAQTNNISGLATLAAKAAIRRVQADALAKKNEALAQIDSAQAALNSAKSVKKGDGSTIVGNTIIQKYVSWALTPTTDTTA
jgi:hypothetical protein